MIVGSRNPPSIFSAATTILTIYSNFFDISVFHSLIKTRSHSTVSPACPAAAVEFLLCFLRRELNISAPAQIISQGLRPGGA
jgi:hypothetical protein